MERGKPRFDGQIEVVKFFGLPLALPARKPGEPIVASGFSARQLECMQKVIQDRGIDSLLEQKRKAARGEL